jgi:hypothetical protein
VFVRSMKKKKMTVCIVSENPLNAKCKETHCYLNVAHVR